MIRPSHELFETRAASLILRENQSQISAMAILGQIFQIFEHAFGGQCGSMSWCPTLPAEKGRTCQIENLMLDLVSRE